MQRLRSRAEFAAVFERGVRQSRFPLTLWMVANALGHPRLGISMSRRVGTAARRNRIKRLLRESFRMLQHDLPRGYDLAIAVKPHAPLMLADYQRILMALVVKAHDAAARGEAGPGQV
jgi:ribonuclease P protein component